MEINERKISNEMLTYVFVFRLNTIVLNVWTSRTHWLAEAKKTNTEQNKEKAIHIIKF